MISLICSVGKNNEIGKNNNLVWHFKEDMKFFKETTMNHTVVMGRKTYESIPNGLPGRNMIVLSTKNIDGVNTVNNFEEILDKYLNTNEEIFIIGGASLYNYFIKYATKIYLTEIDSTDKDADTFFPIFNKEKYNKKTISTHIDNNVKYDICLYEKK